MSRPGQTNRTELKRLADRASFETSDLHSILDENLVAHVGLVENGQPLVIPMTYGRSGDTLYLHGSSGSRLMRLLADNSQVCVSVTELNALKVARSNFKSGMHYRSAVIFGQARLLEDEEKLAALDLISNALIPGRVSEARPMTKKEAAATIIVALPLDEASVKISVNEVDDPEEDMGLGYWAGIVPLLRGVGEVIPADKESRELPIPESVRRFVERHQDGR
jgi:nitroimidazol reductase NimA-like FMN-containing flavoprotein (pyridoxamine 5'-phosphate oxidase superfamily)